MLLDITKSLQMQERARKRIPGVSQLLSKRPDMFSWGVWPGYYDRAKGVEVWDLDGNRYLDMSIGGIGANVLGYADADVDAAVKQAIDKGSSSSLNCPEEVELADLLCALHPWAEKVRFARGGGEAMAIAVRIARAYTGKDKVTFCYDDQTEILTKTGFKKFESLDQNEVVATLNPETHQLEYKRIERNVKYYFKGKMIHFRGQRVDLMVTPDHMIYRKFRLRKGHHFKLVEAHTALKSKVMTQMTSACTWVGKIENTSFTIPSVAGQTRPTKGITSFPLKDFIRFMGWYLSEGSCLLPNIAAKRWRYEIHISQDIKNQTKSREIFETIRNLGLRPYRNGHHICASSKELVQYLKQFGKTHDKYIPDWIKNLPVEYIEIFVDAMVKGDGTFEKGKMRKYYSTSKQLIDGMQELLLKMGYSTTVAERMNNGFSKKKIYILYISKENILGSIPREEYYDGYVYCVTVSNHIILVRRNGKIVWSGNCGYHGWHDWYLAANLGTEDALGEHLLKGLESRGVPKVLQGTALPFRYNHLDELEKIVADQGEKLAAIIMEPIRSEQPQSGFLEGARRIANEIGAVFIFDEVSSGFRMNTGGAHLKFGVDPDLAVFSKAMGNGYPIAAIIGKGTVMDAAQTSFISSTMWTERVGPTAALATIKKHRALNAGEHLMEIGRLVQEGWRKVAAARHVEIEVGGIPPLSHFSFKHEQSLAIKALFVQLMLEQGFLASSSFYSMYAHTLEHVEQYIKAVDIAFQQIAQIAQAGDIELHLKGKSSVLGFKRLA